MSQAFTAYEEDAEGPDEGAGVKRASAGVTVAEPARRVSPEEAASLWHAAAALAAWPESEGQGLLPGGQSDWLVGTRADLTEGLGRSRNYLDYLERRQSSDELELVH